MAKSRMLSTNRSEVLLRGYGYRAGSPDTSQELREEDIWAVFMDDGAVERKEEEEDSTTHTNHDYDGFDWTPPVPEGDGRRMSDTRARGDFHRVGDLSLAFPGSVSTVTSSRMVHQYCGGLAAAPLTAQPRDGGDGSGRHHMAASGPVNVPDWSKVYKVERVGCMHDLDNGKDVGSEMVPPHEFLLARRQKRAAGSVLEGAGRTLKGRDMSRVRDAVWSQTGFDG
ncbi:hypothetical protein SAY87_012706 [Trapa incisa]|uniref:Senescence regulator n=1 Tax=Trapa incisa TaxID=236973 RepID=A0AAN7JJ31_9MYRT|nr:hypothetical protein SAY87_012706 [Trapa incisa]